MTGFIVAALDKISHMEPTQECVIWPHGAYVLLPGHGKIPAHRAILILTNDRPADHHLDAAHSCGNGLTSYKGVGKTNRAPYCVAPWHLDWKTRSQNVQDSVVDRTHGSVKLTIEDVREIKRLLHDNESFKGVSWIARHFDVSPSTITKIKKGERWGWV